MNSIRRPIAWRKPGKSPAPGPAGVVLGALLLLALLYACLPDIGPVHNPLAPGYDGEYAYTLRFEGGDTLADGDSLPGPWYAFTPYRLDYKTTGRDSFVAFRVRTSPENVIDTTLLGLSGIDWSAPRHRTGDSSVTVYFVKPFVGELLVEGLRPNGETVAKRFPIRVDNPFSIAGPKEIPIQVSVSYTLSQATAQPRPIEAIQWFRETVALRTGKTLSFTAGSEGSFTLRAVVTDSLGHDLATAGYQIEASANAPLPAQVAFPSSERTLPKGEEVVLRASCAGCDSLRWSFASGSTQTTTTDSLTWTFDRSDTVYVSGYNARGEAGNTDTLFLTVQSFALSVEEVLFPKTIGAGKWHTFRARALRANGEPVPEARFLWETSPGEVWDSQMAQADSLRLYFQDSVAAFTLAVRAIAGGDSSFVLERQVVVRAWRPSLTASPASAALHAGDSLQLVLRAKDANSDGAIASVRYATSEDSLWREATGMVAGGDSARVSLELLFSRVGSGWVRAVAVDDQGFVSDTVSVSVTVEPGAPSVTAFAADTGLIYVGGALGLTVSAVDVGGSVTKLHLRAEGTVTRDTTVSVGTPKENVTIPVSWAFNTSGTYRLGVRAEDDAGQVSALRYLPDSLVVSDGRPIVNGITPDTVWVLDDTSFTISAQDANGTVETFAYAFSGAPFTRQSSPTFTRQFSEAGEHALRLFVLDNEGRASDTVSRVITVRLGRPTVGGSMPGEAWAFDEVILDLSSTDSNGNIASFRVNWEAKAGSSFDAFTAPSGQTPNAPVSLGARHTYATPGTKTVLYYVVDDDGFASDTGSTTILVRLGEPSVKKVAVTSTAGTLYVNDAIRFTVQGFDENGKVDSVFASWDGDGTFEASAKAQGDSAVLMHTFAASDSGKQTVRLRVQDDDGLTKDSTVTVTLLSGAPVVSGLSPLLTWINDDSSYTIAASDANGSIEQYFWDWDNDGAWDDSSASDSVTHDFGADARLHSVRLGVRDDDGVWGFGEAQVLVRLGKPTVDMPEVSPPETAIVGDTVFYKVDTGDGSIQVAPVFGDSNGGLVRYYFDVSAPLDTNNTLCKGSEKTCSYSVVSSQVNVPFQMAVFAKDDDGLLAGDTFWVYPDGPPEAPGSFSFAPTNDSVTLIWEKTFDAHDSLDTEYRVLFDYGSASPSTTVMDWTKARNLQTTDIAGVEYFSYTFEKTDSGPAKWRVVVRDKRQAVVESEVVPLIVP